MSSQPEKPRGPLAAFTAKVTGFSLTLVNVAPSFALRIVLPGAAAVGVLGGAVLAGDILDPIDPETRVVVAQEGGGNILVDIEQRIIVIEAALAEHEAAHSFPPGPPVFNHESHDRDTVCILGFLTREDCE